MRISLSVLKLGEEINHAVNSILFKRFTEAFSQNSCGLNRVLTNYDLSVFGKFEQAGNETAVVPRLKFRDITSFDQLNKLILFLSPLLICFYSSNPVLIKRGKNIDFGRHLMKIDNFFSLRFFSSDGFINSSFFLHFFFRPSKSFEFVRLAF